jgi:hypothetical protein
VRTLRIFAITLSHLYVGAGLVAACMMDSPPTLAIVMLLNVCLSAVHFADFANFRASGPAGFLIRADRRPRKRGSGGQSQRAMLSTPGRESAA